jgi:hypothetical protein
MNDCCKICGIEVHKWNDIYILYNKELYCVECYEHITGKEVKIRCLN